MQYSNQELKEKRTAELAILREKMRDLGIKVSDLPVHENTFYAWRRGGDRKASTYEEVLHYIEGKENDC